MRGFIGRRSFLNGLVGGLGALSASRAMRGDAAAPNAGLVINYKTDPHRARLYDIVDATTGEVLTGLHAWYADEGRGILRCYRQVRDGRGRWDFIVRGSGRNLNLELAWDEIRRDIRIRLKPRWSSESEGLAHREEQWRRFSLGSEADLS